MVLHTVNKSAFASNTLLDCLLRVSPADCVLLIEDGVYGVMPTSPAAAAIQKLQQAGTGFYALLADLRARGLDSTQLLPAVQAVDDHDFVGLASRADTVCSWY